VSTLLLGSGLGPMTIIWIMMGILIFLGCFIDWVGIVMLCVPLFGPIIRHLGFDPIWFGVLFAVNLQMAFLTPPFGFSLFYLKSVAPPEVSTMDVWKSAVPYLCLQFIGMTLCLYFPEIILIGPKYFFRGLQ
jgi:TRAP-type mannitol/chloroaromatic compound transport system permease large subunit